MPEATKPVSVGFFSLGCAKNLVDSQVMAGVLLSESIVLAPSPETADVVIVNTCAFIEAAREEAGESIDAACALKAAGNCRAVVVTGCYPQRYRHEVQERFPDVDAFVGLDGLEDIGRIVRRVMARVEKPLLAVAASARRTFEPRIPGLALTGGPYAYLKIGEGCNHRCAFCAIPGIRGRRRSRSIKAIVTEAEALLEAGYG